MASALAASGYNVWMNLHHGQFFVQLQKKDVKPAPIPKQSAPVMVEEEPSDFPSLGLSAATGKGKPKPKTSKPKTGVVE